MTYYYAASRSQPGWSAAIKWTGGNTEEVSEWARLRLGPENAGLVSEVFEGSDFYGNFYALRLMVKSASGDVLWGANLRLDDWLIDAAGASGVLTPYRSASPDPDWRIFAF